MGIAFYQNALRLTMLAATVHIVGFLGTIAFSVAAFIRRETRVRMILISLALAIWPFLYGLFLPAFFLNAASVLRASDAPRITVQEIVDLKAEGVSDFAFCSASRELFVSHRGTDLKLNQLHQWNIDEKKLLHTYTSPSGTYRWDEVAVSPDGKLLIASTFPHDLGAKAKVFFIDTLTHKTRYTTEYDALIRMIQFDHSGKSIRLTTTSWRDQDAFVYDDAGNKHSEFNPKDFESENRDRLWDVPESKGGPPPGLFYRDVGGIVHRLTDNPLNEHYALTTDGHYVGTSTWDERVRIWRSADLKELFNEKMGKHPVLLFYDSKENQFLVLSGGNTHLRAIKLPR
jgi:WD40 repeat protein